MFDSHAHIAAPEFDIDRNDVVKRAFEAGLSGWMEVGTNLEESKKAVALAQAFSGVVASVGVHPNDIGDLSESSWREIEELLSHSNVKAIGEVGFDFYRGGTRKAQEPVLQRFILLAQTYNLPLIFHVRNGEEDAHEALLSLLSSYEESKRPRGVIHTYSGNLGQMKRYVQLGMYISFSGVLTFKNAGELKDVAAHVPADNILVETDCPFLTPVPHRGQRNEPTYVSFVAEALAAIRGQSKKEIIQQTTKNASQLFSLSF